MSAELTFIYQDGSLTTTLSGEAEDIARAMDALVTYDEAAPLVKIIAALLSKAQKDIDDDNNGC